MHALFSSLSPAVIVALLALGAGAGFLAGLLGIGGGMVMVPFLILIIQGQGIDTTQLIKVAIATSLATILFTSLSSIRTHWRAGAVRWDVVRALSAGIVIGALLGARLAGLIAPLLLELLFAAFVSYSATQMLRGKPASRAGSATSASEPAPTPHERLPGKPALFGMGAMIGVVSSLVGAGGGFLTVPFLTARQVRIQQAIATSAACGFPIALASAIGYMWAGRQLQLGPGMIGFVYVPGLVFIAAASMVTAVWGARTAHRMSVARLKRVFACMLYALAAYMLYRAVSTHG